MKVHFSNVNFNSKSGPNTFAHRLAVQLSYMGCEICEFENCETELAFIESNKDTSIKRRIVQRLDGIWFSPEDVASNKNAEIKRTFDIADHVIWQSEFDKQMTYRWFGEKRGTVIHNGISLERVKQFPDAVINLRNQYKKIFVCASNWHPQKRLKDNIGLFLRLREQYESSCLIIMGANPDVRIADPHIFYTGSLSHEECLAVYAAADWMIHLAWLDHCPNVVIECLSQETPVICSSSGGTHEIVKTNGIIIPEEKEYDFVPTNYDNPPAINFDVIKNLPTISITVPYLAIDKVATEYIKIIKNQ